MAEKNHAAPAEKPENPRKAIREARERRLRVIEGPPKTVKVYAANEAMRGAMRHTNGTRFRSNISDGVEWPNDTFTKRRIAEGSILTEAGGGREYTAPDETKNAREHAAANKPKSAQPEPAEQPEQNSHRRASRSQTSTQSETPPPS